MIWVQGRADRTAPPSGRIVITVDRDPSARIPGPPCIIHSVSLSGACLLPLARSPMAFVGLARARLPVVSRCLQRGVHDYVRGVANQGEYRTRVEDALWPRWAPGLSTSTIPLTTAVPYKVHLKSPKVVGVVTSRGNREYMEDATSVCALEIDAGELEQSLPLSAADWAPENAGDHELARQVEYFGIFDG